MASFLPFKFNKKQDAFEDVIKAFTAGSDLHTDEQGRHLIFRTINGRVRPIRVGAEDFAEWLSGQGVNVNPSDQKTLRELDKELEIMERAAEYGGPALQKQYENYFNERRQQYAQMAMGYYTQALQNQAQRLGMTTENLLAAKQQRQSTFGEEDIPRLRRQDMPVRGWDTTFRAWVEHQDAINKLTPAHDQWYYNRLYAAALSHLSSLAEKGVTLTELNWDDVFTPKFFKEALQNYYGDFFGNQNADPKKVIAAVETMMRHHKDNVLNKRQPMQNFMNYWYGKMQEDFTKAKSELMQSSPVTEAIKEIPEESIPPELPNQMTTHEGAALMGMYRRAEGSKLNAAHRVMIHGLSRLVDSVPLQERVGVAVDLSNARTGVNAVHKEGYKRAFTEYTALGLIPDREDLVQEAISIAIKAAAGSTKQKIAAIKRISMIMGTIDGVAVLSSNPGIQEAQYTRKWHDTAINAGRVRAEGPGLIDIIMDDEKRKVNTYTNQDLKIIHSAMGQVEEPREEKPESFKPVGYTFSGSKMILDSGHVVEFTPTNQDYMSINVSAPDKSYAFETRVSKPPVPLSQMTEEDRASYLESIKTQVDGEIERYKNALPKPEEESMYEIPESGTFRIPLFDFGSNLTTEDRDLLGDIIQHVEEGGLEVTKLMDGAFRVLNPANQRYFDILFNKGRKKLVGMSVDEEGNKVPFTEPSIQDFTSSLGYRSS
jgi:hypothetical protein